MARYYFDIFDAERIRLDDIGLECRDLEEARQRAIDALPELTLHQVVPDGRRIVAIQIRDSDGNYFFRTSLTFLAHWIGRAKDAT